MLTQETLHTSIFRKTIMAVTGVLLIGFVTAHMIGNLLIFVGADWLNSYALHLQEWGPLLWVARIILLAAVGLHIWMAIWLSIENRKARPEKYHFKKSIQTTYAARTMAMSGIIVLTFIIYHLLQFTFGVTNPELSHLKDAAGHHDVYSMVVLSFYNPFIAGSYLVALFLLCTHLSHGISSLFQSLGWSRPDAQPLLIGLSRGYALILFLGYASIPTACFFRLLKPLSGAVG
jgi:succinate dehydrogenase / fumarate reductase cytochrome b subunit